MWGFTTAEQRVHGQIRDDISTLHSYTCFPPASVTGAPKESALNYIRDLESVQRNWYTGSFGSMDTRGHSTWNVIIRIVQGTPTEHSGMTAHLNIGALYMILSL